MQTNNTPATRTKTGADIEAQMRRLHDVLFLNHPERWEKMMGVYFRYMRNLKKAYTDHTQFGWFFRPAAIDVYAAPENYDTYGYNDTTDTSYNCNI